MARAPPPDGRDGDLSKQRKTLPKIAHNQKLRGAIRHSTLINQTMVPTYSCA